MNLRNGILLSVSVCFLALSGGSSQAASVTALRLPAFAHRPQVKVDSEGTLHVVCGHIEKRGDLFYLKQKAGEEKFSKPIQVNSTAGCAAAFNFTIGKKGRAHVLIRPTAKYSKDVLKRIPKFNDLKFMLYCRLNDEGTAFESERDLSGRTFAFEGVGAIIADGKGNVYVFWHGLSKPGKEPTRQIWRAVSSDEGKVFTKPESVQKKVTGACACCSMQGTMDSSGAIWLLYRSSEPTGSKDSYVLKSEDKGKSFTAQLLGRWPEAGCPGSTYSMVSGKAGTVITWDTQGHVFWARAGKDLKKVVAPTRKRSRGAVVGTNAEGEVLFAWAEASNPRQFRLGADLAWQLYDNEGKPIAKKQMIRGAIGPRWSFPAIYTKPNGDFVILYDGKKRESEE